MYWLYAISTFRSFINLNSTVACMRCTVYSWCICHYGPEVMKFEPTPVIRPIFLYLFHTLFVFMPHHFYPLKWSLFLFGRYLDKGSLHQLWVHSTFTDDAFKLTRLKNKLKLLKNKLPSAYRVFFFYLEKINKGDKIKLILTFPRFEFFLKDDVTKYSGCSEVIFKNSRLPLFYPRIFCLKFNNLTSKTRMFQWYLTIQLTLSIKGWCYTERFATTIFSATQRCNVRTML